jgi:hypothetical protein
LYLGGNVLLYNMNNITEMTDVALANRLAELDPMDLILSAEQRAERYALLWERFHRNRAESAQARMMGH